MELIVISDSKIKIMLTLEDLNAYSIDCSTLDYENTETRRAFWSILDEAKHRTGFDAASEKVFVQVYPSRGGGCEMYVTKLGMFSNAEDIADEDGDLRIAGEGDGMRRVSSVLPREDETGRVGATLKPLAYRFEKMEHMISACRRLREIGYRGKSRAYKVTDDCYLILENESSTPYGIDKRGFVTEYAEPADRDFLEIYISEHGKCICDKKAIETLGRF